MPWNLFWTMEQSSKCCTTWVNFFQRKNNKHLTEQQQEWYQGRWTVRTIFQKNCSAMFMAEKFTKKPNARAKLLFFQSNHTLLFCCCFVIIVMVVLKTFVLATIMTLFVESISWSLSCRDNLIVVPGIPFLSLANYPCFFFKTVCHRKIQLGHSGVVWGKLNKEVYSEFF